MILKLKSQRCSLWLFSLFSIALYVHCRGEPGVRRNGIKEDISKVEGNCEYFEDRRWSEQEREKDSQEGCPFRLGDDARIEDKISEKAANQGKSRAGNSENPGFSLSEKPNGYAD